MSLSIKEYFAIAGSRFTSADAGAIGPVLQEIAAAGDITVSAVVEAAKSTNSPMHGYFEWDDSLAAHQFREGQAREIIQSVRVRFVSAGKEYATRAYNVVVKNDSLPREPKVVDLPPSPFEEMLEAMRALDTWRLKYHHLASHRKFNDILVPLLNQISEFREDCIVKRTADAVDPTIALQGLLDWKDQFTPLLQVTALFGEHVGYMGDAIEAAWDSYAKFKGEKTARLDAIEEENETLREKIDYLERTLLGDGIIMPPEFKLTGKEGQVLNALLARDILTKESIMTALYSDQPNAIPEQKIVDVFVCKMRPKLEPFGIKIETIWGSGYSLTVESKAELRGLIEARKKRTA
jgi:two-component system cell cycle response regulator CtrA